MICPKCGSTLPDGAKFCGVCGTKQEPAAAPAQAPKAVVLKQPTIPVAQPAAPAEPTPPSSGKKLNPKILIAAVAAVVVILAVVLFFVLGRGGSSKNAYVLLQDGRYELLTNLDKSELTEIANTKSGDYFTSNMVSFSEDGKYLYYYTKVSGDDTGSLCRAEYGKLKANSSKNDQYITVIATNVQLGFIPLNGNALLYKNGDGTLYYYDGKDSTQLCKSVTYYTVNDKKDQVLLTKETDGDDTLYVCTLKTPDDLVKIDSNIYYVSDSSDFNNILYTKLDDDYNMTLYAASASGSSAPEKIAEDYSFVGYDDGTYYYTAATGETFSLYSLVNDSNPGEAEPNLDDFSTVSYSYYWVHDYSDISSYDVLYASCSDTVVMFGYYDSIANAQSYSDSTIATACQNFVSKYQSRENSHGYFEITDEVRNDLNSIAYAFGYYDDTAWQELTVGARADGYDYDYDAYYTAQTRYETRQQLKDKSNDLPIYDIYCRDNGKVTKVAENVLEYNGIDGGFMYITPDAYKTVIDLDNVTSFYDVYAVVAGWSDDIDDAIDFTKINFYNYSTGKNCTLSQNAWDTITTISNGDLVLTGDTMYLYDEDDESMQAASIDGSTVGSFSVIADDARYLTCDGNTVYYASGVYNDNGYQYGDLYAYTKGSATRIAQDILYNSACLYEDGQYLVKTGRNSDGSFELAMIDKSGNKTVIADDVTRFVRVDSSTLLYISDGDLYRYNGKDKTRVATDVDFFWCREYMTSTQIISD